MVNGRIIRDMREAEKLSVKDLAQKVGCSQSYMSYVETGIKQPSAALLKRIAECLGKPMEAFFDPVSA